jgi:hypothetical protein
LNPLVASLGNDASGKLLQASLTQVGFHGLGRHPTSTQLISNYSSNCSWHTFAGEESASSTISIHTSNQERVYPRTV